jgi:ferredoxin--NADP+ reductase
MKAIATPLRVAIVGAGPSGFYAAIDLLDRCSNAQIDMFDRLPVVGGLARYGVSPDHAQRREVIAACERRVMSSNRFSFRGNIEIGRDITHEQLLKTHHAVIYSSGASSDKRLGIDGEDLPGSHAATRFVGWYNGHPDFANEQFDLSCERAVIIGNGNVALDVARLLLLDPAKLQQTDIAEHALLALSASRVREVVILGRRGPVQSAFTTPELVELGHLGFDIAVESDSAPLTASATTGDDEIHSFSAALKLKLFNEYARRPQSSGTKRLVFRFMSSPIEIAGQSKVESIRIAHNRLELVDGQIVSIPTNHIQELTTGLVIRSVGYRAKPLPGLPFDIKRGVLPNRAGRVIDSRGDSALTGTYVTGWLKRGPSGVIGSNKPCSHETVSALLDDYASGRLPDPQDDVSALLQQCPERVDYRGWKRIDHHECAQGKAHGRRRIKLVSWSMLKAMSRT